VFAALEYKLTGVGEPAGTVPEGVLLKSGVQLARSAQSNITQRVILLRSGCIILCTIILPASLLP
jgi:hypothetical protein